VKPRAAKLPPPSQPSAPAAPDILGAIDGVTFQRERLAPILREILPLIRKDWEENGIDHKAVPLAIDYDRYLQYDLVGILQIVTARSNGALVGYIFAYVNPHIDHVGLGWAHLTWYWLYPEYRGGGIGHAMVEAMLSFLKRGGVQVVEGSEKVGARHGLFEKLGFTPVDTVYRKLF
jgi:GNAT superfamily N-acetyltransferase